MKRYLSPVLMLSLMLALSLPAGAQEPEPAPEPLTDTPAQARAVYPEDVLEDRVPVPEPEPVPLPGAVDVYIDPDARSSRMGAAALRRPAVIIGAHPDDETFSVNYTTVLTERYPVFVS